MISFTPTGILGLKDLGARIEKDAKSPGFLSPRGGSSPNNDISPKTPRRGTVLQNENGETIRMFEVDDYELQFVEMMEVPESREFFLNHLQSFSIPEVISFLKDMWKYKEKRKNIYNATTMKIEHSDSAENLQSSFASTFSLQRKTVVELHRMAQDMIGTYIENDARLQLNVSSEVVSLLLKRWGAINYIKNTVEVKPSSFAKSAKSFFSSESNESDMFSIDLDAIKLPSSATNGSTTNTPFGTLTTPRNSDALGTYIVADSLEYGTVLDEPITERSERSSSIHSAPSTVEEDSSFFAKCLAHALPNQVQETILKLCQLFDSVEFYVYNDLALEHFPKFKKSKEVKNFLLQRGEEFTKKISINMKLGYELDIRYKAKDFVNPTITDKDIYFAIMLCTDAYKTQWQLLSEKVIEEKYLKTSYKAFISNQKFLIGEENSNLNMKLAKIDIQLPFSVDEAYKVALDRKSKLKCDPITLGDFDTYKVDDLDVKRPLSIAFSSESYNIGKLYKTREATFVQTLVFDRKTNCYINVAKTAEFEEKKKSKDKVSIDLLYAYMFKHCGPNKCILTYIYFGDLKLSLDTDMFFKRLIKDRAKSLCKGFSKILAERTSYGNHSWNESVDDVFCLQECLEKNLKAYPQRSWFNEYDAYVERASKIIEKSNSKQNLNN